MKNYINEHEVNKYIHNVCHGITDVLGGQQTTAT